MPSHKEQQPRARQEAKETKRRQPAVLEKSVAERAAKVGRPPVVDRSLEAIQNYQKSIDELEAKMDAINGDASLSADQRNKKYEVQFKKQALIEKSIEDTSKKLLEKYRAQLDAGTIAKLEENVSPEIAEVPEEGPMAGEPMAWETPAPVEMAPVKVKKSKEKELDFDIDVVEPEVTKREQAKKEQESFKAEHVAKAKAKHAEKIMPYIRKQESKDAAADRVLSANASEFVKLGVRASDVDAAAELIAESDRMSARIEKLAKAYPGTGAAQERDRLTETEAEYGAELSDLLGKELMADEKAMKRLSMLAKEREEMGGVQKKLHADVKREVKAHNDAAPDYFEKGEAPELAIMKERSPTTLKRELNDVTAELQKMGIDPADLPLTGAKRAKVWMRKLFNHELLGALMRYESITKDVDEESELSRIRAEMETTPDVGISRENLNLRAKRQASVQRSSRRGSKGISSSLTR